MSFEKFSGRIVEMFGLYSFWKIFLVKFWPLIGKYYSLFLVIIVLISYGQMLLMYVWQDDNALFFKLAHIQEPAGYFGKGIIGNGLTKWAAAPFYPVYLLFGHDEFFYFAFLLILYILAMLFVYKTFSVVLGKVGGRIAGFIFAAGYVASDGIWRMANSATTSMSIIFTSLFLIGYWKFYKNSNLFWYGFAFASFFLAEEITIVRAHYLFSIVVLFELFFLAFKKLPWSLPFSVIRLIPFFYIFKNWAVGASSSRIGEAQNFVSGFLNGDFFLYYGFLSSVANLIIPDWLTGYLFGLQNLIDRLARMHLPLLRTVLVVLPILFSWFLLRNKRWGKLIIFIVFLTSILWSFLLKELFISPLLEPTLEQYFIVGLGGVVLLTSGVIFFSLSKNRFTFVFLLIWLLLNVAIYSAYNPTYQYSTTDRYIAHSFLPLVGIFGILFISINKKDAIGKVGKFLIIALGLGNLLNAVFYEHQILTSRSFPAREFYGDLKKLMPTLDRGDILYFDVSTKRRGNYSDAVATAMMPETTAFAWRYGNVDRYDIKLTTDFDDLLKNINLDNTPQENVNTFWYGENGLEDTSSLTRQILNGNTKLGDIQNDSFPITSKVNLILSENSIYWRQPDLEINLSNTVSSVAPIEVTLNIAAAPVSNVSRFPLIYQSANLSALDKEFWNNKKLRSLAFDYKLSKKQILDQSQFSVASEWQSNVVKNLYDGNLNSFWQSERTGWGREFTFIEVKLPHIQKIDRVVWVNGFSHNTPVGYRIEVSVDGKNWKEVASVLNEQRIDGREPQVVKFSPVGVMYVRMVLTKTLNGDSPVIAEFWPVPYEFSSLDIPLAEKFLSDPLALVPDGLSFAESLEGLKNHGTIQLQWYGNKTSGWTSSKQTEFEVFYDGRDKKYSITIPAGGTQISKIKLANIDIPGTIKLNRIQVKYKNLAN